MKRKILLICGIVSSVLYIVSDVLGSLRDPGYSYADQEFSELTAPKTQLPEPASTQGDLINPIGGGPHYGSICRATIGKDYTWLRISYVMPLKLP
jgi:hypothetical protein